MARPCSICNDSEKLRRVAELVPAGLSDQAIADQVGVNRMSVSRHRRGHMAPRPNAPVPTLVARPPPTSAFADAGGPENSQAVALVLPPGDPAFIAAPAVITDLQQVDATLCRAIQAAEDGGRLHLIPPLVAQRTRVIETRARAGQVGGFANRDGQGGGATGGIFSVTFNFSGTGRTEAFTGSVSPTVIEGQVEPVEVEGGVEPAEPGQNNVPPGEVFDPSAVFDGLDSDNRPVSPEMARLARAFGAGKERAPAAG